MGQNGKWVRANNNCKPQAEQDKVQEITQLWHEQLSDISWFALP